VCFYLNLWYEQIHAFELITNVYIKISISNLKWDCPNRKIKFMRTTLHTKLHKANWNRQKWKVFSLCYFALIYTLLVTYFPKHYFSRKMCIEWWCYILGNTINLTRRLQFYAKTKEWEYGAEKPVDYICTVQPHTHTHIILVIWGNDVI